MRHAGPGAPTASTPIPPCRPLPPIPTRAVDRAMWSAPTLRGIPIVRAHGELDRQTVAPLARSGRSPTSHARHFASASARSWYPLGQAVAGIPSKTSRRHSTLQKRMTWPTGRRGTRDASTAGVCHHYALASSARWRRARGGTVPPPELQHTRPEAPAGRACRGLPSNAPLTDAPITWGCGQSA